MKQICPPCHGKCEQGRRCNRPMQPFPYDNFRYPVNAPESSRIDDPASLHPTTYLSDKTLAWAIVTFCAWVTAMLIGGWL